jgi:hypothetical protein
MGEKRNAYRVFVGKPEGKNHLKDLDIVGNILLRGTRFVWFRIGTSCGSS